MSRDYSPETRLHYLYCSIEALHDSLERAGLMKDDSVAKYQMLRVRRDSSLAQNDAAAAKHWEAQIKLMGREGLADEVFEHYQFGDGVTIEAHGKWDSTDINDWTKIAYFRYDDMAPNADSEKVSFHVRFDGQGRVEDGYALEIRHGNDIGCRGDRFAPLTDQPASTPSM